MSALAPHVIIINLPRLLDLRMLVPLMILMLGVLLVMTLMSSWLLLLSFLLLLGLFLRGASLAIVRGLLRLIESILREVLLLVLINVLQRLVIRRRVTVRSRPSMIAVIARGLTYDAGSMDAFALHLLLGSLLLFMSSYILHFLFEI